MFSGFEHSQDQQIIGMIAKIIAICFEFWSRMRVSHHPEGMISECAVMRVWVWQFRELDWQNVCSYQDGCVVLECGVMWSWMTRAKSSLSSQYCYGFGGKVGS